MSNTQTTQTTQTTPTTHNIPQATQDALQALVDRNKVSYSILEPQEATNWADIATKVVEFLPRYDFTLKEWNQAIEDFYSGMICKTMVTRKNGFGQSVQEEYDHIPEIIIKAKNSRNLRQDVATVLMDIPTGRTPMEQRALDHQKKEFLSSPLPSSREVKDGFKSILQISNRKDLLGNLKRLDHWMRHATAAFYGTPWFEGVTGDQPAALYFEGPGANGKSHLINEIMAGFEGTGVTVGRFKDTSFNTRFQDPSTWRHDLFVCDDWNYHNISLDTEMLKESITGGTIRTERKGCNKIGFTSMGSKLFLMAGNGDPTNLTLDDGLKRRVSICPTTALTFADQGEQVERLRTADGSLSRCLIRGYTSSYFNCLIVQLFRDKSKVKEIRENPKGVWSYENTRTNEQLKSLPDFQGNPPVYPGPKQVPDLPDALSWLNPSTAQKGTIQDNMSRVPQDIMDKFRNWLLTPASRGGNDSHSNSGPGGEGGTGVIDRTRFGAYCGNPSSSRFKSQFSRLMQYLEDLGMVTKGGYRNTQWILLEHPQEVAIFLDTTLEPPEDTLVTLDEIEALLDYVFDWEAYEASRTLYNDNLVTDNLGNQ